MSAKDFMENLYGKISQQGGLIRKSQTAYLTFFLFANLFMITSYFSHFLVITYSFFFARQQHLLSLVLTWLKMLLRDNNSCDNIYYIIIMKKNMFFMIKGKQMSLFQHEYCHLVISTSTILLFRENNDNNFITVTSNITLSQEKYIFSCDNEIGDDMR